MILREFTETGIAAFRHFLAQCRERPATAVPRELLEDTALTTIISPILEVDLRHFHNRREAAEYLTIGLASLSETYVTGSAGLWTWLSLLFFEEVCPIKGGLRIVKNDYYYIFEPKNSRHFYRHLLFIAWQANRLAPIHNRLLLDVPFASLDQVTAEILKRLYLTRIPCVFEVLDRLYWDQERGRARSGIVNQEVRRGDLVHRFPIRVRQLEKTYDLMSLSADQLIELLGDEFKFTDTSKIKRAATVAG